MRTPPQLRLCTRRALVALLAMAASVGLVQAQDGTQAGASSPAANGTASASGNSAPTPTPVETDISQLQRFLSIPPDRLEQMRKAIVYLQNMPPGELAALRQRMHSIEELGTEIRADIRQLPKVEDRSIVSRYLMTLYPEDIQPLLKNFQDAKDKPDVRRQLIQDMLKKAIQKGIKPDPNATDRSGQPTGPRGGFRGMRGPNSNPPEASGIPTPVSATPASTTN